MKITKNLVHIATDVELEAAVAEDALKAEFDKAGLKGFPAELDIAERTEEHVQMVKLEDLLGFAAASGVAAVTYDVTYFPQADEAEVDRQVAQLARDLEISPARSARSRLPNIWSSTPSAMLPCPFTASSRHMSAVRHSRGTA